MRSKTLSGKVAREAWTGPSAAGWERGEGRRLGAGVGIGLPNFGWSVRPRPRGSGRGVGPPTERRPLRPKFPFGARWDQG